MGQVMDKKLFTETIMYKIHETNFRFHVKLCITVKLQHLVFSNFSLLSTKISFWKGDWTLDYNFVQFLDLSKIYYFFKIPSHRFFGNSWGNLYIPFLLLIVMPSLTSGEKTLIKYEKVSNHYDHRCSWIFWS